FAGVRHWDRALRQAQHLRGNTAHRLVKLLVAARIDRAGVAVSDDRVRNLVRDLSFDGYFATSAREGWSIRELREAVRDAIQWHSLPIISSNELFQHIKTFLVTEKTEGRLLSTVDDLYRAYLKSLGSVPSSPEMRSTVE